VTGCLPTTTKKLLRDKLKMKTQLLLSVFFFSALSAHAVNKELLGTAKSANLLDDVVWNKTRHFNSDLELGRMERIASGTNLSKYFRITTQGPDIILKLHEDVTLIESETISLTVYDPDDNGVLYFEERPLVELNNDITRLISHFLAKVDEARKPYKEAEEAAARERLDEQELHRALAADEAAEARRLRQLKTGRIAVRPGGMKVQFSQNINLNVREDLLKVLNDCIDEDSLKDQNYAVEFRSKDGELVTYEFRYKGAITRLNNTTALSPMELKDEILKNW
jgi:hypothetical protein